MTGSAPVRVGVVGCGAISAVYLPNLARLPEVEAVACADVDPQRARQRAEEYHLRACTVEELLRSDDVDLVLNLTVPLAHAEISLAALRAGKHVYTEKPLATDLDDGRAILAEAERRGLLVGCAPDTFLGAATQTCRRLIDLGAIGRPVAATVALMSHGMEAWHPNPTFFFEPGGGPVLDIGPYALTTLVHLVGPIRRVTAVAQTTFPQRVIGSELHRGETIDVRVPTHVVGILEFEPEAIASYATSWDVWYHHVPDLEIYGTEGSLSVGDPNAFLKVLPRLRRRGWSEWVEIDSNSPYREENWRGIGVEDMAHALRRGGSYGASGALGYHVLEVMTAMDRSASEHRAINIESRPPLSDATPTEIVWPALPPGAENDEWLRGLR